MPSLGMWAGPSHSLLTSRYGKSDGLSLRRLDYKKKKKKTVAFGTLSYSFVLLDHSGRDHLPCCELILWRDPHGKEVKLLTHSQ